MQQSWKGFTRSALSPNAFKRMKKLELKIPPVGVAIVFVVLSWGCSRWIPWGAAMLVGLGWVGKTAIVVGSLVAVAGIIPFRRARTSVDPFNPQKSTTLVRTGIYSLTRNPMYLGMGLVVLGSAVHFGSFPGLLISFLFFPWMTRFQIAPEERVLTSLFGRAFELYRRDVDRKSTRMNSSHITISYAVFCLKKKD